MSKKTGILATIGGAITSVIGFLGLACVACAPICGGLCITGPLVAIFGVGVAGFLHNYGVIFVIAGILLFILGIFLTIKNIRKNINK